MLSFAAHIRSHWREWCLDWPTSRTRAVSASVSRDRCHLYRLGLLAFVRLAGILRTELRNATVALGHKNHSLVVDRVAGTGSLGRLLGTAFHMRSISMRLLFAALVGLIASVAALAAERTATFAVENMTCSTCPLTIEVAVKKVDGVKDVRVNYERKTATVAYDDARTTAQAIAAAMNDAGFPATLISSKP